MSETSFTEQHLENVTRFIEKARKGTMIDLGGGRLGIKDGVFIGMVDKMTIVGDLISLKAECRILERVAAAAREMEDPPPKLLHVLQVLHRENQMRCPECGAVGNPFPGDDPVTCVCGHVFTLAEGCIDDSGGEA